jgi:hypothetical protein
MAAASALREAVCGLVSELYLAAPGIDYVAYDDYLGRFEQVYSSFTARYGG